MSEPTTDQQSPTLRDLLERPSQMAFWSNLDNLITFLAIQAEHHHAGASPHVSEIGNILDRAAQEIRKISLQK